MVVVNIIIIIIILIIINGGGDGSIPTLNISNFKISYFQSNLQARALWRVSAAKPHRPAPAARLCAFESCSMTAVSWTAALNRPWARPIPTPEHGVITRDKASSNEQLHTASTIPITDHCVWRQTFLCTDTPAHCPLRPVPPPGRGGGCGVLEGHLSTRIRGLSRT